MKRWGFRNCQIDRLPVKCKSMRSRVFDEMMVAMKNHITSNSALEEIDLRDNLLHQTDYEHMLQVQMFQNLLNNSYLRENPGHPENLTKAFGGAKNVNFSYKFPNIFRKLSEIIYFQALKDRPYSKCAIKPCEQQVSPELFRALLGQGGKKKGKGGKKGKKKK